MEEGLVGRRGYPPEFRRRVATAEPGAFLFPSPTGGIWTNTNFRVRCRWTEVTTAVGLPGTTIHDLSHTTASLLIAAGAGVKAAQVIPAHATATMTIDLYGHLFSDAPWVAMERLPTFPERPTPRAIGPGTGGAARDQHAAGTPVSLQRISIRSRTRRSRARSRRCCAAAGLLVTCKIVPRRAGGAQRRRLRADQLERLADAMPPLYRSVAHRIAGRTTWPTSRCQKQASTEGTTANGRSAKDPG